MSDIEAGTQAETPTEIDAPNGAFNAHSASTQAQQDDIAAAWAKSQAGDPVDRDVENVTPKQAAAAKAKPEAEAPEGEEEVEIAEAEVEGEEEPEAKPTPKAKVEVKGTKPEKLTQAESRALIEQRVEMNKRFQRRDQQWQANVAQREAQIQAASQEHEPMRAAIKLFEAGDLDGFATQLGLIAKDPSIKNWNGLNEAAINAVSNPMYKRMRQLERQTEERQAELAKQHTQYQAQQAQAAKDQEIANWKSSLADEANSDEDPAIGNLLTSRPQMVDALFSIQQRHFHESGGDTLPVRDAAIKLLSNVREDYKFWSAYFEEHSESDALSELLAEGVQAPKPPVNATVRAGRVLERQTTKKTSGGAPVAKTVAAKPNVAKVVKNVSQAQTASASALKPLSEKQLLEKARREMEDEWRNAG